MAEEQKIVLKVEVDGMERNITSMQELKKARKDLQNAFLQGDEQAIKSLKKLDDAMGDLQDATKSVQGDGVEPLRNSFRLFTEGLTNFDFGKIGTAFKGLGAAMKAVPIFLLVEGITYLITNFKELSKGTGILATVLKPIGEIIGWITDGLYALTDAIGLTNTSLDKMGENTVKNAESSKEALSQQNAEYDRQIKVAKAAGESTVELEKAKQQAIIDTNVQIVKQIEAFVRAGGVLDEEKKKLLTASLEAIKNAKVEEYVIEKDNQKKINDAYKAAMDERKRLKSLEFEANKKFAQDEFDMQMELLNALEAEKQAKAQAELDSQAAMDAEKLNMSLWRYQTEKEQRDKDLAEEEAAEKKKRELKQQTLDQSVDLTKRSLQATQELTALYFDWQLKQAQNDSKRQLEIKKRQFQVEKAFKVAMIVIDTVLGGIKAISQNPPPNPIGIISAALIGVAGTLATIKVLSTKFDGGGAGGGSLGGDVIPGGGAISGASAPAINQPNNTITQLNDEGINQAKSQPTQKVVVVESDITEKQKTVAKIEETATI